MLIYCTITMTAMFGFVSFAVDLGRVQVAKTELRRAADAAARAAIPEMGTTLSNLQAVAQQYGSANLVDGTALSLDATNDIAVGTWDTTNRVFVTTAFANANAVRITARRTAARGNAVPLLFAAALGQKTCDVSAVAIAAVSSRSLPIHGNYNPYRAGNSRNAPGHDPARFPTLPITPGHSLSFNNNVQTTTLIGFGADGDTNNILTLPALNGISGIMAPNASVVAVFLDDNDPSLSAAPASLDFSNNGRRNFTSVSPLLKQLFFIGDGTRVNPNDQVIVVPPGATRLFFGVLDQNGWTSDWGTLQVTPTDATTGTGAGTISIVK